MRDSNYFYYLIQNGDLGEALSVMRALLRDSHLASAQTKLSDAEYERLREDLELLDVAGET